MAVYRVGEKFRVAFGKDKHGWRLNRWMAVYRCDCGERFLMQCRSEKTTQSCGCLAKETARQLLTGNTNRRTHNQIGSRTYKSWAAMKGRCADRNNIEFERYGGRGISVCDRWLRSFSNFFEDMGERPVGTSIDRIDPNGNYDPDNCRWASAKKQARNRRYNVLLTIDGETKTVAEWCENPLAAKDKTIYKRVKNGWDARRAVFG